MESEKKMDASADEENGMNEERVDEVLNESYERERERNCSRERRE